MTPKRSSPPYAATLGFVRRSGDAVSKLDWAGETATALPAARRSSCDGFEEWRDSHIGGMSVKEDGGADESLSEAELQARRHAAALALGLYPVAVVWADRDEETNSAHAVEAEVGRQHLTEAEWHSLTPLLPAEAPQAKTMSNREFLEAVLNAMRRTG